MPEEEVSQNAVDRFMDEYTAVQTTPAPSPEQAPTLWSHHCRDCGNEWCDEFQTAICKQCSSANVTTMACPHKQEGLKSIDSLPTAHPLVRLEALFAESLKLMQAKNADYAGQGDFWKNLEMVQRFGIVSAEVGMLVRMTDKLSRISTLITSAESPKVAESIEDTLKDLMNYAALMIVYRRVRLENEAQFAGNNKRAEALGNG